MKMPEFCLEDVDSYIRRASQLIKLNEDSGIKILPFYSNDYIEVLKQNNDYPALLFSIGDLSCCKSKRNIGILGSMDSLKYSIDCARRFGEICAENNITIVSILNNNCNISAINGALRNGGRVVLITPTVLSDYQNSIYKEFYLKIIENGGCVISCMLQHRGSKYISIQNHRIFNALCLKLIIIDGHKIFGVEDILKAAVINKKEIGFLSVKEESERLQSIYLDRKLMAPYKGKPLVDKQDLAMFLSELL